MKAMCRVAAIGPRDRMSKSWASIMSGSWMRRVFFLSAREGRGHENQAAQSLEPHAIDAHGCADVAWRAATDGAHQDPLKRARPGIG